MGGLLRMMQIYKLRKTAPHRDTISSILDGGDTSINSTGFGLTGQNRVVSSAQLAATDWGEQNEQFWEKVKSNSNPTSPSPAGNATPIITASVTSSAVSGDYRKDSQSY